MKRFISLLVICSLLLTACATQPKQEESAAADSYVEGEANNQQNSDPKNDQTAPEKDTQTKDPIKEEDPKTDETPEEKEPEQQLPDDGEKEDGKSEEDTPAPTVDSYEKLKQELLSASALSVFSEEETHLIPTPDLDFHSWGQGGWTDGKYYYQAFVWRHDESNQEDNKVTIVKYDMNAKKVVKQSKILALNHCNDITYDAKNDRLVIVHNKPNWRTLTFMDPDTLEVIGTRQIDDQIFGMDYDAVNDRYVIGISSGYPTFRELDSSFMPTGKVYKTVSESNEFVRQTVACTEDFIFHLYHLPSYIYVYDWEGNFVTKIDFFGRGYEPENLSVVNGTIYVSCNDPDKSGNLIFELRDLIPY